MPEHSLPDAKSRLGIFDLPPELILQVLEVSDIPAITAFRNTCTRAHDLVEHSQSLWKSKFLEFFDDPRPIWESFPPTARRLYETKPWNWQAELVERLGVVLPLWKPDPPTHSPFSPNNASTLLKIMRTSRRSMGERQDFRRSVSQDTFARYFWGYPYWADIIHGHIGNQSATQFPDHVNSEKDGPFKRSDVRKMCIPEWASRLHIYCGYGPSEEYSDIELRTARGIVYDQAVTDAERDFGPFKNNGSGEVDWKILQAIMTLAQVDYFQDKVPEDGPSLSGLTWNIGHYTIQESNDPADWAGIQGPWEGSYGRIDPVQYAYWNIFEELGHDMDLAFCELFSCETISMNLELGSARKLLEDPALRSQMPFCDDLPKLFFTGEATVVGRAACVKGCCWLTPGAQEVRWRFLLSYEDGRTDRLEGVQPAGVRTGCVYGLRRFQAETGGRYLCPFMVFPDTKLRYGTRYPWGTL